MAKFKGIRWSYWIPLLFLAALCALFVRSFLLVPLEIEGNSMEPTLHSRQKVIVQNFGSIQRFDVVIIKMPDGNTYIKRVIGMPGDRIAYHNDRLYINGDHIKENFLKRVIRQEPNQTYTSDFSLKELTGLSRVPTRQYFVLGDNRRISKDSRTFGTVKASWITGRALIVYWPIIDLKKIGKN
ncbi:signal peptidase I [Liquorilactobacillus capillatus]|uniref:Signal peptidase I n=1 Tax=Liquorilactobacillus capillatus DSM 19910 TaxID=1423731 RepID=A0A0R1LZN4_9LACO|nr:signal peptidase I [Liquorilactobacillus capillatus]KRL01190.1 Signal peptidase I [Liquorilactobacillus capillatus DSM 19910]